MIKRTLIKYYVTFSLLWVSVFFISNSVIVTSLFSVLYILSISAYFGLFIKTKKSESYEEIKNEMLREEFSTQVGAIIPTEEELKLKKKLTSFSLICIIIYFFDLSIKTDATLGGFFQVKSEIPQDKLYICLTLTIIYYSFHYFWNIYNHVQKTRIKLSFVNDHNNLRHIDSKGWRPVPNIYAYFLDKLEIESNQYDLGLDECLSKLKDLRTEHTENFKNFNNGFNDIQNSISNINDFLNNNDFKKALIRFDCAYMAIMSSENLKWLILEFMLPSIFSLSAMIICIIELV